jgi:hypothetical protein
VCLFVAFSGLSGCQCDKGQVRPGPVFDGSARWAVDLAQPRITAFAPDAELRSILGARVAADGRLFANVGSWSVIAFSQSRQEKIQVTVSATGALTESVSAATGAGIQVPLPPGWINSPEMFNLARQHVPAFNEATLVTFNFTDFGGDLAGKATWAINTPGGNVLVSFDGAIARPQ